MEAVMPRFRQGAGRICLDFIRTLRYRGRPGQVEELPDEAALAAWVSQFGPALPERLPTATELATARRLREAIYELITAVHEQGTCEQGTCASPSLEAINTAGSKPPPVPQIDAAGQLCWHAADPVAAMLALLARDAIDLVATPAIGRLRRCANPDCQVLFLDNSRPGARRWCDMGTCGNQAKKAAFRAKPTAS